jgi:hypothetical protein
MNADTQTQPSTSEQMTRVRTRLTDTGLDVVARPPEEFLAQIKAEIVAKGQLIRESGAKPD